MSNKYSAVKEWLFPSSKIWTDISKWRGFCVGAFLNEENIALILVMSSLSG